MPRSSCRLRRLSCLTPVPGHPGSPTFRRQWMNCRLLRNLSTRYPQEICAANDFGIARRSKRFVNYSCTAKGLRTRRRVDRKASGWTGRKAYGWTGRKASGWTGRGGVRSALRGAMQGLASEHWRLLFCPAFYCPGFDGVPRPCLPSPRGRALLSKCGAKPSSPPFDWPVD